jgi:hypothetical protein
MAIAHFHSGDAMAQIKNLWPVLSVHKVARGTLEEEQTGVANNVGTNEYWLFELGTALALKNTINDVPTNGFRQSLRLTTLASINGVDGFHEVAGVYEDALALAE